MGNGRKSGLRAKQGQKRRYSAAQGKRDLSKYAVVDWSEVTAWRHQFGHDNANEWIYVGTSDSMSVNSWLRKDEGMGASGYVYIPESRVKKTIKEMETWFDKSPKDIQTIRNVDNDWLQDNFGTTDKQNIANLINDNVSAGMEFRDPGFLSMSTDANRNVFGSRSTTLHIGVPKGSELHFTGNSYESEIIGNRDSSFVPMGAYVEPGVGYRRDRLHIFGVLKQNKRKKYN